MKFSRVEKSFDFCVRTFGGYKLGRFDWLTIRKAHVFVSSVAFQVTQQIASGRGQDGLGWQRTHIAALAQNVFQISDANNGFHERSSTDRGIKNFIHQGGVNGIERRWLFEWHRG